jgi:hypothetical protein
MRLPVRLIVFLQKAKDPRIARRSQLLTDYFFTLSFAAFTNPTNSGCGFIGRERLYIHSHRKTKRAPDLSGTRF